MNDLVTKIQDTLRSFFNGFVELSTFGQYTSKAIAMYSPCGKVDGALIRPYLSTDIFPMSSDSSVISAASINSSAC